MEQDTKLLIVLLFISTIVWLTPNKEVMLFTLPVALVFGFILSSFLDEFFTTHKMG